MQTLGLSGKGEHEDNFFQRLFWPTVHNSNDADLISRRGFWVALVVGTASGLLLLASGHPILALLVVLVYLLGGVGIRQQSIAACVLIPSLYALGLLTQWIGIVRGLMSFSNPLLGLVGLALLLATVRATALTRKWAAQDTNETPESIDTGFVDAIVNRMPRRTWPAGKHVFYVLTAIYGALSLFSCYSILVSPGIAAVTR